MRERPVKIQLDMYLRFVVSSYVESMGSRQGFFDAAYNFRSSQSIDQETYERVNQLLEWFGEHLVVPDSFSRSKSISAQRGNTKGLSWFKPDARTHIQKAFELYDLLNENGIVSEVIKSERIGYVVYEDDVQIIAEPFAETPR